jgi:hypothetical protein
MRPDILVPYGPHALEERQGVYTHAVEKEQCLLFLSASLSLSVKVWQVTKPSL